MVVHHYAVGVQCYIGGAPSWCTIVHQVHSYILVMQNPRAPLFTGCAPWCTG